MTSTPASGRWPPVCLRSTPRCLTLERGRFGVRTEHFAQPLDYLAHRGSRFHQFDGYGHEITRRNTCLPGQRIEQSRDARVVSLFAHGSYSLNLTRLDIRIIAVNLDRFLLRSFHILVHPDDRAPAGSLRAGGGVSRVGQPPLEVAVLDGCDGASHRVHLREDLVHAIFDIVG